MGDRNFLGNEQPGSRINDHLALDRTQLANERTLLAYLRTAVMLIVTGATALEFVGGSLAVNLAGWCLIGLGVCVAMLGTGRFARMRRAIRRRAAAANLER
jgi:inner membrane protein YidH